MMHVRGTRTNVDRHAFTRVAAHVLRFRVCTHTRVSKQRSIECLRSN